MPEPTASVERLNESIEDSQSDDSSSVTDDDADVALLGAEIARHPARTWGQVKDIVIETLPTLLFTTIGLLFTGELLDHVSHWKAMRKVDELIIIIPVILNLKGNLEMNLSARLGTAANVGELDEKTGRYGILLGNLALLQAQAALVSFVSAILSFFLGLIMPRPEGSSQAYAETLSLLSVRRPRPKLPSNKPKSGFREFVLVASTGMSSACLSSLLLGSFMCTLVIFCRKFSLDPDNIAPPIAACLGDLITLCLLGLISTFLVDFMNTPLPLVICVFLILTSLACAAAVHRNEYVRSLIRQGWTPLFGAMVVSTATGIILDLFVSRYNGFALLAVLISGLPGAVGSIFVSRISTMLHAEALHLHLHPPPENKNAHSPHPSLKLVLITLFIVTIPVELVFLTTLRAVGWLRLPFIFIGFSVFFFCVTVLASLYIARSLTKYLWKHGLDPDMYAMPIHSSVVDLIGQLLLVLCFELVSAMGWTVETKPGR